MRVILLISFIFGILFIESNSKSVKNSESKESFDERIDLEANEVNTDTAQSKPISVDMKEKKECDKSLAQCMKCGFFAPKIEDASCPPGLQCCVLVF